jgi:hypothetical protein
VDTDTTAPEVNETIEGAATDYPHHFIMRRIGGRPKGNAFHLSRDCAAITPVPDDQEVVDADVSVVEFLSLKPCARCVPGAWSRNIAASRPVIDVLNAVRGSRLTSEQIANLIEDEMYFRGYKFTRKRKANDVSTGSPLQAFIDDQAELSGQPDPEHTDGLEAGDDTIDAEYAKQVLAHLESRHGVTDTDPVQAMKTHTEIHEDPTVDHDLFDLGD